jgi:hypothetical protein
MKRLIDAFEGLFIAANQSGGELAKTARFTLENVNWKEAPNRPEPTSHDIVDSYLEAACAASGPDGSSSRGVARALSAVTDQLAWRASSKCSDDGPDIDNLLRNFAITVILGEGGLLPSDKVCAGFSLQAPDTYYPPHAATLTGRSARNPGSLWSRAILSITSHGHIMRCRPTNNRY